MKHVPVRLCRALLILCVSYLPACSRPASDTTTAENPAAVVNKIADRFYAETLEKRPEIAYLSGVELERHDGMEDNHPDARKAREDSVDEMLRQLKGIDVGQLTGTTEWITYSILLQELQSSVDQRICRWELWNVSQMSGWHLSYTQIAQLQPVGTPELREQSLVRWAKFATYVEQEIVNLEEGLREGYSAPKTVVRRVIDQVDGLLALGVEQSPFYSPAASDNDEEFAARTKELVENQIYPALQSYRDYLADTYLEVSREALSVAANPNGLDCYEASLRAYTTLDRSGEEVYELGEKTVEANRERILELGKTTYALEDMTEIIDHIKSDPADKFASAEALLAFSREAVQRAEVEMPAWVGTMPTEPVEVVPFEEHEEGTGRSAHYNPASAGRPAEYRIPLHRPEEQSRGSAEIVAFHEAWPGHHLQIAFAQSIGGLHPVSRILWFAGPGEGWARYSEALAEEMGLYATTAGLILRRAWPARGMVVDPGIHLFDWTREQAIEFMMASGSFSESESNDMVDRIAILPGQLTAYDSGGLEIFALRRQAEEALGEAFDIREFHDRVLESGTIPLAQLRQHIESWLTGPGQQDEG